MTYRPIKHIIYTCKLCGYRETRFAKIIEHLLSDHTKEDFVKLGYKLLIRERVVRVRRSR